MKPLIVGLNNPLSRHPDDALVAFPPGCSGDRLLKLIQGADETFTEDDYYAAFDRANLWRLRDLPSGHGKLEQFRLAGEALRANAFGRRDVVLLGVRVWNAVTGRLGSPPWFEHVEIDGTRFWALPHPSGQSRYYNVEHRREQAGRLLLELVGRVAA